MASAVTNAHFEDIAEVPGFPEFNMAGGLHGEEEIEVIKPLEAGKTYTIHRKIKELQDKIKLSILITEYELRDSETQELYTKLIR